MNTHTWTLIEDITARVQRAVRAGDQPAILGLHGTRNLIVSDYDYLCSWATALAFEIRAAAQAQSNATHRWVLAVPQVWYDDGEIIQARPLHTAPVQADEQEAITWMSCDDTDGVDYGRVPFTRRPNGEPVFDDPEYFTSPVHSLQRTPGAALHRLLTANIPDLASHLPT
ncbi:hypothetical protein CcI156_17935 [Frankia sp. CcI156]|uniref:Uncharacterized protein n=1 Tax=Frankia casuarinae (strain DSM 45818 / CECT 9043 / HFP020203 / CcI3) TaxID=106370 RepID=Q2JC29_FRACC|nr:MULTISPECIES: hypothetical protein [Frankia]ABD11163.1 hypothetical protein Francci3_1787 [Frankia casuarinae]ETA00815.1 hypothetical protein CcI6DRAFT_03756 [Frankia sp. CcI6]EYT91237.1 hypothetical protein ThrDRAFT_03164 [Frankia casuarinae]KFB03369.1 hypothetical protein ALLO2DRAFT_03873 [Frankia sp. Allo2]OAA21489.1 hypothetical protein AAY23_107628 [Frankia casuarinae]